MKSFCIGFVLLALTCGGLRAQTRVQATGSFMRSHPTKPGYMILAPNALIQMSGMVINCDYAEYNPNTEGFEGYGNLRIRTREGAIITGKNIKYFPQAKNMVIDKDVVYQDKETTLFTDRMIYDRFTEVSTYTTGGRILSDSAVLVSQIGHYHSKTRAFHCKKDVVITHPDYVIHTDTMQMANGKVDFFSPTHVYQDSNYLYCEEGWYLTRDKIASLKTNAFILTPEQKLYGDSIYYNMNTEYGEAYNNVVLIDSLRDMIIHSHFALSHKKEGYAWFTDQAVATVISDNDSLFLRGDTLRVTYDSLQQVQRILAYHHVRFFRTDLQGKCDSLSYSVVDSTMRMYVDPVAWSNSDQLTGDTITLLMANNKPQQMTLEPNAFITSIGKHESHYNQVKGRRMYGFFNDSSALERIDVKQNVETIYYVTDDADSSLIGILKVNAENMSIYVEDNRIMGINYVKPENGSMFPEKDLPASDRILKGFQWLDKDRPKSKFDIFNSR